MRIFALAALALLMAAPQALADPTSCPEKSYTVGQYERQTVAVHSDCTVDVILGEGIICLGGGVGRDDTTVGPVNVTRYYCTFPGPEPQLNLMGDVYVPEFMACTWTGSYKPYVTTPVVTVWVYTCDEPSGT